MKKTVGAKMGKIVVEFDISNYRDVVACNMGAMQPDQVRRAKLKGVVDTGAGLLVLPSKIVKQLGLIATERVKVRFADGRRGTRGIVDDVYFEFQGRHGTFKAVVEQNREDALIGVIVLETLDFLPDCNRQCLVPRDPNFMMTEIE